jgi:hypothetical protein
MYRILLIPSAALSFYLVGYAINFAVWPCSFSENDFLIVRFPHAIADLRVLVGIHGSIKNRYQIVVAHPLLDP